MIENIKLKELKSSKYLDFKRMSYTQNGVDKSWDLAIVHDSVAILLYDEIESQFILVKQFRPPVYLKNDSGFTYELCAGIVDKDKSLEEIAKEEIEEECGYLVQLKDIKKITSFYTSVGFAGAKQTLFFAKVDDSLKINQGGGVDLEDIEVIKLPREEAIDFIFDESKPKTPGIMFALNWFLNSN